MKITNNYNLPEAIYKAVCQMVRKPREDSISVTQLVGPVQIRQLTLKHWDEMEEDASNRLWALFGQMGHSVLEASNIDNALSEEDLIVHISDKIVTGRPDLYKDKVIDDYKFTSVYSFLLGDKPEWTNQLNCYAFLYHEIGFFVEALKIHAILRDWQKSKALQDPSYPEIPFMTVSLPLWSVEAQRGYIIDRLEAHDIALLCTDEERWYKGTKYAVMKGDNKRATKVFDNEIEANRFVEMNDPKKMVVVERKGGYTRCESYCPVSTFCEQWAISQATQEA